MMFQIQDTVVSSDLAERFFCCDLAKCLGACCIKGESGAPVTQEEAREIEKALPEIEADMLPRALAEVRDKGVAYRDAEGDLVTTLLPDGTNCAFSCYGPGGVCLCALEKACRQGRTAFRKPASCALYPVRLTRYPSFTAVNVHRWKICRPAEVLGREKGLRLYQFLKGPLTDCFGPGWYAELELTCREYLRQKESL